MSGKDPTRHILVTSNQLHFSEHKYTNSSVQTSECFEIINQNSHTISKKHE